MEYITSSLLCRVIFQVFNDTKRQVSDRTNLQRLYIRVHCEKNWLFAYLYTIMNMKE